MSDREADREDAQAPARPVFRHGARRLILGPGQRIEAGEADPDTDAPESSAAPLMLSPARRVADEEEEPSRDPGRGPARSEEAPPPSAPEETAAAAPLDEARLREMIAEVVREELRGDLGRHVTRNLRKLARQEVRRALAGGDEG